jgi:cell wall-associated NlpC family hydrolase
LTPHASQVSSEPPAWCAPYVGIEYEIEGLNCWGFVARVMRERFGLDVPLYETQKWTGREGAKELGLFVTQAGRDAQWQLIWSRIDPRESVAQERIEPGDVMLCRIDGQPVHVGVVAASPWFLHTEQASGSVIDRLDSAKWARRVVALYRFRGARLDTSNHTSA